MSYTNLRDARVCVIRKQPFTGSSTLARWSADDLRYIVYSYGDHFPMYIWDSVSERWYANTDKYSVTTSKHQSMLHPPVETIDLDTHGMKALAECGLVEALANKIANEQARARYASGGSA